MPTSQKPQSRVESILIATINGEEYNHLPESRIEALLLELKEAIEEGGGGGDARIYKVGGSKTFENLGTPSESTTGWVYNITNEFTTNQYFIDGAGKYFPAGTNVVGVISEDPLTGDEIYWWDTLSGMIDLSAYLTKEEAAETYTTGDELEDYPKFSDIDPITAAELKAMWDSAV